jgi:2-keto-4-pentenoate hydratase
MTMDPKQQRDLARLLAALRRDGRQQSGLEAALVPPTRTRPTASRAWSRKSLGWPVAGWKIAAAKAEMQRELRTDAPIYGRVFAPGVNLSPMTVEHARQCSPIPEAEYQARLGADLPPREKPYTMEEVTEAVASLHPGIELAECRFVHDDKFPPLSAVLADGAGCGTLCHGPAIEDWRTRDIAGQEVVLLCNGVVRRRGTAAAALDHPMVPLTWFGQRAVAHRHRE